MRGLTLLELLGLYALVIGLGGIIGSAFLVSVALGVLAVGLIGVIAGPTLLYLAAAREQAARDNGQHAAGGNAPQIRSAA